MKRINITLTEQEHQAALDLSKEKFGKSNVSGYYAYLINREKSLVQTKALKRFDVKKWIEQNQHIKKIYQTPGTRILTTRPPMHLKSLSKGYHLNFDTIEDYINEFISKGIYRYELSDLYSAIEQKNVYAIKTIIELTKQ